ncbi:GNAT family N-acetyltransferase [Cellulomonas marina]|uniref:Protein N-acetyltransferase, RimJ/RimL family n=2 Tax=Cellulomonas marina TaxID=988821 RepID=A0A1I1AFN7_9CELL|nr:GNAT family protein [Cellulomonas marina]SFB35143.1 Protein N-acetyltransferase, RimJ/RimL family [Cellulomonas marina]
MTGPSWAALWPPSAVRVRSGDLELRYLDDELLLALADLASRGLHDEDRMPFLHPWTRGTPAEVARSVLTYQWAQRAALTPSRWSLELAVLHQGRAVGVQAMTTTDFPVLGAAETGSWLGREHQGRGLGRQMRHLVLHLLFEGLGARTATTSAREDNAASLGVTRALGYRPDGTADAAVEGMPARILRFRLDRADWDGRPPALRPPVTTEGLEALRAFLPGPTA